MQREAFLYFIADYPRVIRTVTGFPADQVCHRAMILNDAMEQFCVPAELTEIDRAILQASIEHSDWLEPFAGQSEQSKKRYAKKLEALRECAARLESIGIEVSHIPS